MLALSPEQTNALVAIKRGRDLRALASALTAAFPDVATRAGDRLPTLIEHGIQRGAAFGLLHAVGIARYLACWFMFGAEFEAKPEGAWARDILAPVRPEGSKVFQLCRRGRELLSRPQAGQVPAADFEAAIRAMDTALMPRGQIGSLLPPEKLTLGEPCDIDALDLRVTGPAPQIYKLQQQGQWQRTPTTESPQGLTLSNGAPLPAQLHLLAKSLRVRSRAEKVCDHAVHPLLQHAGEQGLQEWRGHKHAADVTLHLSALPAPQGQAVEGSPSLSLLTAAGCGLRENGEPFGEQKTQLAAYPADQHLLAWKREASSATARARIERDGQALDAARWTQGLADLDKQLKESLARLTTAWERESGVTHGRVEAEPQVMTGVAALTWGWAAAAELATPPHYRAAGMLDLIVCELKLRLGGELMLAGSQSRLALHVSGSEKLNATFERKSAAIDMAEAVKTAQCSFRQPFVLHIESIANAEQPALLDQAGPVAGAVVGSAGLRMRADGPGLEWFCELAIEPVAVRLVVSDPLIGQQTLIRPLLPAMKLVSWRMS